MKSAPPPLSVNVRFYLQQNQHIRDKTSKSCRKYDGVFYSTRFASPPGSLIPLTPQESLVLYRPPSLIHQPQRLFPTQQLWLFERVGTG